jgi:two-component system LytT family response regulator
MSSSDSLQAVLEPLIVRRRNVTCADLPSMRILIAEPEPVERAMLVELCRPHGGLRNLIVVESGTEALAQIRASRPDVCLLACDLNDMTGFDVLHALHGVDRPAIIMVAPDDRYAAEAVSSAATHYLPKPVSADRLALALFRVRANTRRVIAKTVARNATTGDRAFARYAGLLPLQHGDRLMGERAGRFYFFSPNDIDYIEADSNYVKIHVGSERYIRRDSLTRLSALLENFGFVRISRTVLLNLQRVAFAEREGRGVMAFVLESGAKVVSSTRFRLVPGPQLRMARVRGRRDKSRIA